MGMKPARIFIFFISVTGLLLLLSFLFPGDGIALRGGYTLRFFQVSEIIRNDSLSASGLSASRLSPSGLSASGIATRLLAASTVTEDPEYVDTTSNAAFSPLGTIPAVDSAGMTAEAPDPVPSEKPPSAPHIRPANADSLSGSVHQLEFSGDDPALLQPFFKQLERLGEGSIKRTRILHYGDSQIENDRMTALIRYRLQLHFSGTGTGLVQPIPLYSGSLAYEQKERGEWLRYTFFGKRDSTIRHNNYGVMGAFASVPSPTAEDWPMLQYRFRTSRRSGQCNRVRIFMHSYAQGAAVAFRVNGTVTDTLHDLSDGFSVADFSYPGRVEEVEIFFRLPRGGRIYGISFESEKGLQMDNIAMRGGSGLIFSKMNREHQQEMFERLGPGLIILQFGGNVVPYLDPGYYRRAFIRELNFLREIIPETPIIVIGPSDMSVRTQGGFATHPKLEQINDALRDAALQSGCIFWNLYEAMGGANSMPSFVHTDPPLASTDFVHFTQLGANLVAEMFYNSLMLAYSEYTSSASSL